MLKLTKIQEDELTLAQHTAEQTYQAHQGALKRLELVFKLIYDFYKIEADQVEEASIKDGHLIVKMKEKRKEK